MKRLVALLLAGMLLLGGACGAADADPEIRSWDFALRFHLNAGDFPFRQRERMQGYADLLEALEVKGNLSWCEGTNSLDLRAELVPLSNPAAAVSFRMTGAPELVQITSALLGKEAIWLEPARFMYFAERTWEALQIPLPYLALLLPVTTADAFRWLADTWTEEIGPIGESRAVPYEMVEWVAGRWQEELEHNNYLKTWVDALTNFLPESEPVETALQALPELLLAAAAGEDLAFEAEETGREGKTLRCLNTDGVLLFEEHADGPAYGCALTPPETGAAYTPSFSFRREETDGTVSLALQGAWDRAENAPKAEALYDTGYTVPDAILQVRLDAENLPLEVPTDAAFSGRISVEGYLLPNFDYLFSGSLSADGAAAMSVTPEEKPENGPVFTGTGTIVSAVREEPLAYDPEALKTEYNLFGLNDESLHRLVSGVLQPFLAGMIDFLYEVPASACQSVMDDLEAYGILQTLLK